MPRNQFTGTAAICALEVCEKKANKHGLMTQMGVPGEEERCLCCGHQPVSAVVKFDSEADYQRRHKTPLGKVRPTSKVPR